MTGAGRGGKTVSLSHHIGSDAEGGMMVKTAPPTSLEVTQAQFLFQFLIIACSVPVPSVFGMSFLRTTKKPDSLPSE
jgi:hypothetical protein